MSKKTSFRQDSASQAELNNLRFQEGPDPLDRFDSVSDLFNRGDFALCEEIKATEE